MSPLGAPGLGVPAGLGLGLEVTALTSGEPAGLVFFEGGRPEGDCRSLPNSNFLFVGGYGETRSTGRGEQSDTKSPFRMQKQRSNRFEHYSFFLWEINNARKL